MTPVSILGCDDATACHNVVLRPTDHEATCLTHCEGTDPEAEVPVITNSIVRSFFRRRSVRKVAGAPPGRLHEFDRQEDDIHLVTLCVTELNGCEENETHIPIT
ncbi:hypothetical protein GH733_005559 [Mirounga leonina]|nr:hypothetical protein GH733_005559 [Mirounga leonina]